MRKFQSHKVVEAEQISEITGNGRIILVDGESIPTPADLFARYHPSAGDYLIRYDGGYLSVSPRAAFEDGYTEVKPSVAKIAQAATPQQGSAVLSPKPQTQAPRAQAGESIPSSAKAPKAKGP